MGGYTKGMDTQFFIILWNYRTDISPYAGYLTSMSVYGREIRLFPQCILSKYNNYNMNGQCKKYDQFRFQPFESSTIFWLKASAVLAIEPGICPVKPPWLYLLKQHF